MTNQSVSKNNTKLYWILGGIVSLLVIGVFFVIVLAAGVYFYTSSKNNVETTQSKRKDVNLSDKKIPTPNPKSDREELLKRYIKGSYSRVGKFSLKTVINSKLSTFGKADVVLLATYREAASSDTISHWYADYPSWEVCKKEATEKLKQFKAADSKMKPFFEKERISGAYVINGRFYDFSCDKAKGNGGLCNLVTGKKPKKILKYLGERF